MTPHKITWLYLVFIAFMSLTLPRHSHANSSEYSLYRHYKKTLKTAKSIYRSYRLQEKSFNATELSTLCELLNERFAKLRFASWESGFTADEEIHPYIRKSIRYRTLISSMYRLHRLRHKNFVALAMPLLHNPEVAQAFFDPDQWIDPKLDQALRAREQAFQASEQRLHEIKKYLLYENRRYL